MPVEIRELAPGTRVLVKKTKRNKVISHAIPKPLSNKCFTAIVAGASNSGKSVLIDSLLGKQYRACFTSVILVCPETSRQCFENSVFEGCDPKKTFDELNDQTCEKIMELIVANRDEPAEGEEPQYTMLVLDDVGAQLAKNAGVEKWMRNLLSNYRHLHCCCLLALQSYLGLHKRSRDLFRQLFQFSTPNALERKRLADEWLGAYSAFDASDIMDHVWDRKYNFLMCDRQENLFAKNFNVMKITKVGK